METVKDNPTRHSSLHTQGSGLFQVLSTMTSVFQITAVAVMSVMSNARSGFSENAFFDEERLQLALLKHLFDDVTAADELTLHIKLRDGRPI